MLHKNLFKHLDVMLGNLTQPFGCIKEVSNDYYLLHRNSYHFNNLFFYAVQIKWLGT